MQIRERTVSVESSDRFEIRDVTPEVTAAVEDIGASDGIVWVSTPHTSAALSTNEYEEKLLWDMKQYFIEHVPPNDGYFHDLDHIRREEAPNAHAHIIASMIDRDVLTLLRDGELDLGSWEAFMFFELCGPREREVDVVVLD
jgi:secondary thiamine-phosphate synthase enzyme